MDGAGAVGPDSPAGTAEARAGPAEDPREGDGDVVVTTVVDGTDPDDPGDIAFGVPAPAPPPDPAGPPIPPAPPAAQPVADQAVAGRLAEVVQKLAPLEGLADAVGALRQAVRLELERCAGVLFSHDRALSELNDRLAGLAGRVDAVEEGGRSSSPRTELYEQALGHVLEQLEGFDRRLRASDPGPIGLRVAEVEERLGALEPLPAVVRALRVALRADEELLATEVAARRNAIDGAGPLAAAPSDLSATLAALEARLAPLEAVPDDVAALGRVVRRELDAVTTDSQTRDQLLRRALQKEIERLQGSAADREEAVRETSQRLELLERRVRGAAQTQEDAAAATTRRLEALEARLVSVDALAEDIDTLRTAARRELERLRTVTQSHDQSIAEIGKRFAALDGRLTRLDPLPGEVQALRTAMRQGGDRMAVTLRSVEERSGEAADRVSRQLRQLADAVTQVEERVGAVAAEVASAKETLRGLEVALAETTERLDSAPSDPPRAVEAPAPTE